MATHRLLKRTMNTYVNKEFIYTYDYQSVIRVDKRSYKLPVLPHSPEMSKKHTCTHVFRHTDTFTQALKPCHVRMVVGAESGSRPRRWHWHCDRNRSITSWHITRTAYDVQSYLFHYYTRRTHINRSDNANVLEILRSSRFLCIHSDIIYFAE